MPPLKLVFSAALLVSLLTVGCAVKSKSAQTHNAETMIWSGRLAVQIDAQADQPQSQVQTFAAGFELAGNAQTGELTLFTPLGTTAASLSWSNHTAALNSHGEVQHFESLDSLIRQQLGTTIPVAALFAWLAGDNMEVAGWSADLTQHANGRITARRIQPTPMAQLRLVFEK
jgi:outer membrane lipoprotein LolB